MQRKNTTRRELLRSSAALGFMAAVPFSFGELAGCGSKKSSSLGLHAWRELRSPAAPGSLTPRVSAVPDGGVILSWLEPQEDGTAALRFSIRRKGTWAEPATIAAGLLFSRDRAAAPGIIPLSTQNFIAYWSQKPARQLASTNEIELYAASSIDAGVHWSVPFVVNRAAAQPGEDNAYASAAALDDSNAAFIWLDGRNWEKYKRVQLMSRTVGLHGGRSEASVLDEDTCTCCSTTLVRTPSGLLASYRGHTPDNIRDIALVRTDAGAWSQPRIVHPDRWQIAACPVNGPYLDTDGERTALIWFTAPQDQPAVNLAFSENAGAAFASPIRINSGKAIGRAQIVLLPRRSAATFWLENEAGAAKLMARQIHNGTLLDEPFELARGGNFGYPHAARGAGGIFVAWPEKDAVSRVRVGFLKARGEE